MAHFITNIIYTFLVRPWLKYVIGVRFSNTDVFNETDQFILVANHNSHFDTISMMAALPWHLRKKTSAVAAGDYFGKTSVSGFFMKLFFNAILVNRNRRPGEPSSLEVINKHLKDGRSIIIFPEGSRGTPGVVSDFKKGIAFMLKENPHIPVIPTYLDGFGRVLPKGQFLIIPLICKVHFGKPVYSSGVDIETTLEQVKTAILDLKRKDERDRNQFVYHT